MSVSLSCKQKKKKKKNKAGHRCPEYAPPFVVLSLKRNNLIEKWNTND
jgi:hypothetical protein